MAKLLLACDDYVYQHKGRFYAGRQDLFDFYQRYLRVFEKLRLVARCATEDELKSSRVPLDIDPRIEFVPLPMFHGMQEYAKVYLKVGHALSGVVNNCDAAVLRIPSTVALRVGSQVIRSGIPYACEVVYDAEDSWRGATGLTRLVWKQIDKQMRCLCGKANGVSCVTEYYLQQHYFPLGPSSFTTNYSSLSLPFEFYGGPKAFPKHRPFLIAHTASPIEYNGRKGHIEILNALSLLKQNGINVKVRFAGNEKNDGIERLKEYASKIGVDNMVEFVGFLNREELNQYLSSSDLYVMPTRAEGLPRVIIEAMAKGLPCITTPVSGNPELVETHFLVEYEDVYTLAKRIEELSIDAALYESTSKRNYDRSLNYQASILESRRDGFYRQLKMLIK